MRGLMAGLVRREMDLQQAMRDEHPAHVYPGLSLLLLLCCFPVISRLAWLCDVEWMGHSDHIGQWQASFPQIIQISATVVAFFLCLRACIYPAAALGRELESRTLVLFRTLPSGIARLLWVKYIFSLWPLWLEGLLAVIFYSTMNYLWGQSLGDAVMWGLNWWWQTCCAVAGYGALGLWLGSLMEKSEKAALAARLAAVLTLLGGLLLNWVMTPPILVAAALMYLCLLSPASYRQGQVSQGGIATIALMLMVMLLLWAAKDWLPGYSLSDFTPLYAVHTGHLPLLTGSLYLLFAGVFAFLAFRNSHQHL